MCKKQLILRNNQHRRWNGYNCYTNVIRHCPLSFSECNGIIKFKTSRMSMKHCCYSNDIKETKFNFSTNNNRKLMNLGIFYISSIRLPSSFRIVFSLSKIHHLFIIYKFNITRQVITHSKTVIHPKRSRYSNFTVTGFFIFFFMQTLKIILLNKSCNTT